MDISATVYENGKVTIPVRFREKFAMQVGDKITFSDEGGELKILTKKQQLQQAQAIYRQYFSANESAVDTFIAERRKAAEKEAEESKLFNQKDDL